MLTKSLLTAAVFLTLSAAGAEASTGSAWADLDMAAIKSCKADIVLQSGKSKITSVTARVLGIGAKNDVDRFYALTLRGKNGRNTENWLCLYEKHSHKAVARELN